MSDLNSNTEVLKSAANLKHGEELILLGSCFSDNMASKFEDSGFEVLSNPFGTIYHPLAIAESISDALDDSGKTRVFNREDIWLDWRASGTVYSMSEEDMKEQITNVASQLRQLLLKSKLLVVTFGTSWGYSFKNDEIVANCHKMPGSMFAKSLSSLEKMKSVWCNLLERLRQANPNLTIAFTVSPIDHIKDGLIENGRSKARLIELCHQLVEDANAEYFHSYELVKTMLPNTLELDGVSTKLNPKAIPLLWKYASDFFLDPDAALLAIEIQEVNRMRNHKSIHPESNSAKKFKEKVRSKQIALSDSNPKIYWRDI